MARSGWSAAIRSSNRIYEKSPSDPRCSPRIANHLRRCSTTESRLALAVERVFQQPARPVLPNHRVERTSGGSQACELVDAPGRKLPLPATHHKVLSQRWYIVLEIESSTTAQT